MLVGVAVGLSVAVGVAVRSAVVGLSVGSLGLLQPASSPLPSTASSVRRRMYSARLGSDKTLAVLYAGGYVVVNVPVESVADISVELVVDIER